jgi:hypothetical protein
VHNQNKPLHHKLAPHGGDAQNKQTIATDITEHNTTKQLPFPFFKKSIILQK